jgi:hypothetical protein
MSARRTLALDRARRRGAVLASEASGQRGEAK